jgi:cytochrome c oxidase assembly factor CtaG
MKLSGKIAACAMLFPISAWAHGQEHITPENWGYAWSCEPWALAGMAIATALYVLGLPRIRQALSRWNIASFAAGMLILALTLMSPIHELGSRLFSAHMAQHEFLMLIAAPLLVLGRPGIVMLWALPQRARVALGHFAKLAAVAKSWTCISSPLAAWLIHGSTLWVWHVPVLYQATLQSELVHATQHATFLGTALLFWWTLIHGSAGRMSYGAAVAYVFTTAVHTSVLGALLTCSTRLWYPIYQGRTALWGLSALEDQQLGGLIMWVPAGVVYIALGLWLFAGWLRESERRFSYSRAAELTRAASLSRGDSL